MNSPKEFTQFTACHHIWPAVCGIVPLPQRAALQTLWTGGQKPWYRWPDITKVREHSMSQTFWQVHQRELNYVSLKCIQEALVNNHIHLQRQPHVDFKHFWPWNPFFQLIFHGTSVHKSYQSRPFWGKKRERPGAGQLCYLLLHQPPTHKPTQHLWESLGPCKMQSENHFSRIKHRDYGVRQTQVQKLSPLHNGWC